MEKRIGVNVVTKSRMFGGGFVYTAWEPSSCFGPHHTITYIGGVCYGDMATLRIGAEIEGMKGGSLERIAACDAHRAVCEADAYALILAAFGDELTDSAKCDSGRIRTV